MDVSRVHILNKLLYRVFSTDNTIKDILKDSSPDAVRILLMVKRLSNAVVHVDVRTSGPKMQA